MTVRAACYNDGTSIEGVSKFQDSQDRLVEHFGGLTFFPQPNPCFWKMVGVSR